MNDTQWQCEAFKRVAEYKFPLCIHVTFKIAGEELFESSAVGVRSFHGK